MFPSRVVLFFGLAFVFVGTKGQDDFDLADAFKDGPTKAPAVDSNFPDVDLDFDDPKAPETPNKHNNNHKFTPTKLPKQPANGDPDRQFGDIDLVDVAGGASLPDKIIPKSDNQESGQDGGSSGTLTGIITGVLLAVGGGVSSYILYQKKKLCFSLTGNSAEQNTKQENVRGQREDPQSYSTLLQTQPVGSN